MNPAIRTTVKPLPDDVRWLFNGLPPLVLRLRRERLVALGRRVDPALRTAPVRDLALAVGELLSEVLQERIKRGEARRTFVNKVNGAATHEAEMEVLRQHIRSTTTGREQRRDLAALQRWLDADALLERIDRSIDAVLIDARLLMRAMLDLPLRGAPLASVAEFLKEANRPTRRLAVTVLSRWMAALHRNGIDADGEPAAVPERLEAQIVSLVEQGAADVLEARRAVELLAARPDAADRIEARLARGPLGPRDFLVRVELARAAVRCGAQEAIAPMVVSDPSETVRCGFVHALLHSGVQADRELAHEVAADDVAASVRATLKGASSGPSLSGTALSVGDLAVHTSRDVRLQNGETIIELACGLLPLVRDGRGFSLEQTGDHRVRVHRGARRVARMWRFADALRHPDPGRRQGGDHLSGQHWRGAVRVPSRCMAEVSPTGVPGRAVRVPGWDGWAPWLPTLDDLVDALSIGTITLVTEEGITTLQPPAERTRRQRARAYLIANPRTLDRQRRASLTASDRSGRAGYANALSDLGFELRFESGGRYPMALSDVVPTAAPPLPAVTAAFATPLLAELWAQVYASSDSRELFAVTAGIAGVFLGRLAWSNYQVRQARAQVPLVIGGWGTRGKSGVERLKAALFDGLGVEVTCKTTGCEAMLVHTPPGRPAVELFLYRPYDRASIWEHAATLRTAAALKSPVFLWECMALKPHYVQILQRHWTRDDLSTVTNTYPDHEDVHGPTGEDVAQVISQFIPDGALALTAETEMTAVLRERASERGTDLVEVDRDQVTAMPGDLVELFPHQEHPANIALVAQMAEELGVDAEEAVVLMSEYVIPDLGSLATFPPVRHRGRVIQYSNGSSANERTGFLNNWRRCGFADHALADVGTWIVTVVNNRYDRVARSQVFAEILVRDARAHKHVFIGSNLEGLRGYVTEALDEWVSELDLLGGGPEALAKRWAALTDHLLVVDPGRAVRTLTARLDATRTGHLLADRIDTLVERAPARVLSLQDAEQMSRVLDAAIEAVVEEARKGTPTSPAPMSESRPGAHRLFPDADEQPVGLASLQTQLRELIVAGLAWRAAAGALSSYGRSAEAGVLDLVRELFWQKVVSVDDAKASGDVVIDAVATCAPAGAVVRAMSVQNIKGTGLDFVYRWVYGRPLLDETALLGHVDEVRTTQILQAIEMHREWSIPLCREVLAALDVQPVSDELTRVRAVVLAQLKASEAALRSGPVTGVSWWRTGPSKLAWTLWDPFDAILRRRIADRLFKDLAEHRIGHARCAFELRRLTERGKGD